VQIEIEIMCRLSYKGLGEPLCFVAFGPLAVSAAFLCHALPYVAATSAKELLIRHFALVMSAATVVGLTTTSILFCSHFHQIKGDMAAGKRSPLSQLGTSRACQVMLCLTLCNPRMRSPCYEILMLIGACEGVHWN
jgi:1,4-dihydroxy-2-naphthoate octaprenyltransferase